MPSCPRCTATLELKFFGGVETDICPACEGEWLDHNELRQLTRVLEGTFTSEEIAELDAQRKRLFRQSPGPSDPLLCPRCPAQTLTPFNYAGTSGIILDKCPRCGGIWVDHKELAMVGALVQELRQGLDQDAGHGAALARKLQAAVDLEEREDGGRPRLGFVAIILRAFN